MNNQDYSRLMGLLFQAADTVKLAHLKAKGVGAYAQHVALGDLYDSLTDYADLLTETYQGYVGILDISIPFSSYKEPVEYVKGLRDTLNKAQSNLKDKADIQNIMLELIGKISKTIYKLENLQ